MNYLVQHEIKLELGDDYDPSVFEAEETLNSLEDMDLLDKDDIFN